MPDDMTTVGRLLQLPPIPDIPEPFRGRARALALDAGFVLVGVGIATSPEQGAAVAAHVGTVRDALSSWESDTASYINFAERDIPGDRLFGPYAHHRLRAVKAAYAPGLSLPVEPPRRPGTCR
jgi:hypothetical protein